MGYRDDVATLARFTAELKKTSSAFDPDAKMAKSTRTKKINAHLKTYREALTFVRGVRKEFPNFASNINGPRFRDLQRVAKSFS